MTAVLLWKEYREQRAYWLAIALLAVLLVVSLAATFGHGSGLQVFQDEALRNGLPMVLICLNIAYGVVSGALLLAGESDDGTLVFLDMQAGWRRVLWGRKCLAGVLLTLSLSLTLVGLAVGLGFGSWPLAIIAPLLGLDALVWGLLGGAVCRKVLPAVLTAITFMALSWLLLVGWGVCLEFTLRSSELVSESLTQSLVEWGVGLGKTALVITAVSVSWWNYCRVDQLRQSVAVFPASRVLLWLVVRQGRWILAACLVGTLLLAFIVHRAPLVLWPFGTLLLGLICGLAVFSFDQNEGNRFWGWQRFPPGTIWIVKILGWGTVLFGLLVLAWSLDTVGGVFLFSTNTPHSVSEGDRGHKWFDEMGERAKLIAPGVFLGLWPLYGFCFGQFFGQVMRRPILADILAIFIAPSVVAVWIPSLLFGGLPVWQLLIVPVMLLLLTWLNQRAWLSDRLWTFRPLTVIAGGTAAMSAALIGCLWYRVAEIPEVDEPFDVQAFTAALPSPEQNEAGPLLRRAVADMSDYRKKVEQQLGPPKEPLFPEEKALEPIPQPASLDGNLGALYFNGLLQVLEKGNGWPKQDKELGRWLDRLFEGQWVQEAQQVAQLPLGMVLDPRLTSQRTLIGNVYYDGRVMASLFVGRALQLQARGDSRIALNHLATVLALSRQMRNDALIVALLVGISMEGTALDGFRSWLQNVGPDRELVRDALVILQRHEAATPDPVTTLKAEFLVCRNSTPEFQSGKTWVDDLLRTAYQVPWEKERQSRLSRAILNAVVSAGLRRLQRPLSATVGSNQATNDDSGHYSHLEGVGGEWGLPPKDGPGSRLSGKQWGELVVQFIMNDPWYLDVSRFPAFVAKSQNSVRVAQVVTAAALYQAEHGKPPNKLDDLVPTYLAVVPDDRYTDRPFRYGISPGEKIDIRGRLLTLSPGQAFIETEYYSGTLNKVVYPVPVWTRKEDKP